MSLFYLSSEAPFNSSPQSCVFVFPILCSLFFFQICFCAVGCVRVELTRTTLSVFLLFYGCLAFSALSKHLFSLLTFPPPRGQSELIPFGYYIQLGEVRVAALLFFYTNNVRYSGMSQGFLLSSFDVNKLRFRHTLGKETKIHTFKLRFFVI